MSEPAVSTVQLRAMLPSDYEAVIALWRNTEGMGLGASDSREAIVSFLARNPGLSRVAIDSAAGGEIVGALLCGHDGRRGHLHHLAVARSHRRQGIGHALVEAALADLRALKLEKCNLALFTTNENGRRFWEHEGWSLRGDIAIVQRNLG